MPTNILRKASRHRGPQPDTNPAAEPGVAVLTAGRTSVRVQLRATATARLIWRALPLYSTVETWGASIHFETPLETGRDRTARINGVIGELYFWTEDDRILVPFGPTPISRPGECRLPCPCNVWAHALDDVKTLAGITPGEKVSLVASAAKSQAPPSRGHA